MPTTYAFVLVDESTLTDDAHGGPLTPAILTKIGDALWSQLNGEVGAEWGCRASFRVGTKASVLGTEIACLIEDSLPDAPDAAAYHTTLENGAPVAYFSRQDYTSHTSGPASLSVDLSHECIEIIGDPGANRWADAPSLGAGIEQALELCDPVQNTTYLIGDVAASNFLLQAAFAPGAPGPYDYLRLTTAQGDYSQGYVIVRSGGAPTDWDAGLINVNARVSTFGEMRKTERRRVPTSRLRRRARGPKR